MGPAGHSKKRTCTVSTRTAGRVHPPLGRGTTTAGRAMDLAELRKQRKQSPCTPETGACTPAHACMHASTCRHQRQAALSRPRCIAAQGLRCAQPLGALTRQHVCLNNPTLCSSAPLSSLNCAARRRITSSMRFTGRLFMSAENSCGSERQGACAAECRWPAGNVLHGGGLLIQPADTSRESGVA